MLLIECLVHAEGPNAHGNDVCVKLHGNDGARDGARKGPLRSDGLWEWCRPASPTGVVETRGLLTPHPPALQ